MSVSRPSAMACRMSRSMAERLAREAAQKLIDDDLTGCGYPVEQALLPLFRRAVEGSKGGGA